MSKNDTEKTTQYSYDDFQNYVDRNDILDFVRDHKFIVGVSALAVFYLGYKAGKSSATQEILYSAMSAARD